MVGLVGCSVGWSPQWMVGWHFWAIRGSLLVLVRPLWVPYRILGSLGKVFWLSVGEPLGLLCLTGLTGLLGWMGLIWLMELMGFIGLMGLKVDGVDGVDGVDVVDGVDGVDGVDEGDGVLLCSVVVQCCCAVLLCSAVVQCCCAVLSCNAFVQCWLAVLVQRCRAMLLCIAVVQCCGAVPWESLGSVLGRLGHHQGCVGGSFVSLVRPWAFLLSSCGFLGCPF